MPRATEAGETDRMGIMTALFAFAAAAIISGWVWLGAPVQMPPSPLSAGEKVHCISYAPFRDDQEPFGPDVSVDPGKIADDLAQLKSITDCVRTYSVDHGLDRIAEIAAQHGMKVIQGLWLSSFPERNRRQIETTVELARRFPDVITAVVVGNEVLLRGEMSARDLARTIAEVKSRVSVPVTYADVWEFWLRYREISPEVDFITIHILPYWEDFPIASRDAASHVDAIRKRMVTTFPGKEIFVGEFGWPSAGRMREGALPSAVDQARAMHETLALAHRESYRVNLFEAYDQPWKRQLEGTVGGHWGLFDGNRRTAKFAWGEAVSNHPHWRWQAAGGVGLAAAIFGAAFVSSRRTAVANHAGLWLRVAAIATVSGSLIGWTFENVPLESLGFAGWLRSLAWASVDLLSPILTAALLGSGKRLPTFAQTLARAKVPPLGRPELALGVLLIALALLALPAALGLVFDPRYRDFPFAPLTGAAVPLLFLAKWKLRPKAPAAERVMAAVLGLSATYIVLNEGVANWQACWFGAALGALALTVLRAQAAPS
jgi:exo-beta-1,3-glucanase (GH17 family)